MLLLFPTVFHPKNLPKILPKRRLNDQKIDFKNACVFIIDFFAFGRRFWSLLGLQDGAKLAILAPQRSQGLADGTSMSAPETLLGALESPGVDLGPFGE